MTDYEGSSHDVGTTLSALKTGGVNTGNDVPATTNPPGVVPMEIAALDAMYEEVLGIWVAADYLGTTRPSGFDDVWFERVLIFPNPIDFGNIAGSVTIDPVEILNNYRRLDTDWTTFVNNSVASEVTLTYPALSVTIFALGTLEVVASVAGAGNPTVDGTLDFTFTEGGTVSVEVSGTRVTLFPFIPESPSKETIEFKTGVIENNNGTEQRYRKRRAPRMVLEYSYLSDGGLQERDYMNGLLHARKFGLWAVPLWHEAVPLTTAITAGDSTIYVDTRYGHFREGGLVTVVKGPLEVEVFQIDTVTSNSITVSGTFTSNWAIHEVSVMPCVVCSIQGDVEKSRYTTGPDTTRIKFVSMESLEDLADTSAFGTYNSLPLLDRPMLASDNMIREGVTGKMDTLDVDTFDPVRFSNWSFAKPFQHFQLFGASMQTTWEIRQLAHALAGKWGVMYVPTGREDMRLQVDAASLATTIDIDWFGFTDNYGGTPTEPRKHLQVVYTDGTVSQHEITQAVEVDSDTERLTISPGLTKSTPVADVARIEFLTLSRLSTDEVDVEHDRPGQSYFTFNMLGVSA